MRDLFGDKLKRIRIDREMSQEQLAILLGTSKQVISRYETNQRTPKITIAQEYADKLNVPLNYLIDENLPSSPSDSLPQLNIKEERDIAHDLEKILSDLANDNEIAFQGEPMDNDEREMLRISIENSLRLAKQMAKKKSILTKNKD
jgi:transcriptional regulator with XRE-family HTH domain